jgi:hypothetical protein
MMSQLGGPDGGVSSAPGVAARSAVSIEEVVIALSPLLQMPNQCAVKSAFHQFFVWMFLYFFNKQYTRRGNVTI